MSKCIAKKLEEHRICFKINLFVENVLRIRSFALKITVMFLSIFVFSSILTGVVFSVLKIQENLNIAQSNISLATKIRQHLSQQKLDVYTDKIQKLIEAGMVEELRKERWIKEIQKTDRVESSYRYSLRDEIIIINVDGYLISLDKHFLYDIIQARTGVISKFNPIFEVGSIDKAGKICSKEKYRDSDFYLIGCIERSFVIKNSIFSSLKDVSLFLVILIGVSLTIYGFVRKVLLFPIMYIIRRLNEFNIKGIEGVRINLHKFGSDELALISKTLEDFRRLLVRNRQKMDLIFETVNKMISMTNNIHNFGLYVLNQIDKIMNLNGSILIMQSTDGSEEYIKSDRYIKIRRSIEDNVIETLKQSGKTSVEIDGRSYIVMRKSIEDNIGIIFIGVLRETLSEEDRKYIDIILSDFVYIVNINNLATQDFLTKLPNRRKLMADLKRFIELSKRLNRPLSILLMDIDDFKAINDTHGHDAGDVVLKSVANIIKESVRGIDIVGRYGGEEFLVILPNSDKNAALEVAERIRSSVEMSKFHIDSKNLKLTISIGVATLYEHGETPNELVKAADIALYRAKREGKNKVAILQRDEIEKIVKLEFEAKDIITKALEEDRVAPFYQPIFDAKSESIIGYEVLARIFDSEKNSYTPAYLFVNDALKFGLGFQIDNIVQEKTFEYLYNRNIKDKMLFLNLSKFYFSDAKNLDTLHNKVMFYGLKPENIVLEITEEEAITEIIKVKEFIRYGKYLGFKFAVDDFGAGYSNFIYLKHFNVDIVKIDGSLIYNIDKDPDNRVIVESIVKIAKHKNIKTLAEMVETQQEFETLKSIDVDYVQGFYLSKPVKDI